MRTGERPGPTEPNWPTWERRTGQHEATEAVRGVCACVWLEPKSEDLALWGMGGRVVLACIDCGAYWEREA